jgi:phage terminase large subunit-like protein
MQIRIDQALTDKRLLGAALGDNTTWQTWRIVMKAAFGLSLNEEEARAFASVAGSRKPPEQRVRELWCIIGRRGGKSRMAAAVAVYCAAFVKHRLAAGEIGIMLVLAASTAQAKTVFEYIRGSLDNSPALRKEVLNANPRCAMA